MRKFWISNNRKIYETITEIEYDTLPEFLKVIYTKKPPKETYKLKDIIKSKEENTLIPKVLYSQYKGLGCYLYMMNPCTYKVE